MRNISEKTARLVDALVPGLFAAGFIAFYAVNSKGLSTILSFGASMAAAYVLYFFSCYRRMPEPERFLPLYLLAVALQLLHFIEEFSTGFHIRFPVEIYHAQAFSATAFFASQTALFALLVLAGIGIYKRWKMPLVMAWFLVVMLEFVNAVQHPIFAFMAKGYFPGLFTSLQGWFLGPLLFKRLWETRKAEPQSGK
jgi:hypothetical protein